METTTTPAADALETLQRLADQICAGLANLAPSAPPVAAHGLRLAQALSLSLVDQVAELRGCVAQSPAVTNR